MTFRGDVALAHAHSSGHRAEVMASAVCGCFFCLATFPPTAITQWVDWPEGTPETRQSELGQTAICPRCGVDSVIGSGSGFPITPEFLGRMEARWFNIRGRQSP
jgi:hypothetical protein